MSSSPGLQASAPFFALRASGSFAALAWAQRFGTVELLPLSAAPKFWHCVLALVAAAGLATGAQFMVWHYEKRVREAAAHQATLTTFIPHIGAFEQRDEVSPSPPHQPSTVVSQPAGSYTPRLMARYTRPTNIGRFPWCADGAYVAFATGVDLKSVVAAVAGCSCTDVNAKERPGDISQGWAASGDRPGLPLRKSVALAFPFRWWQWHLYKPGDETTLPYTVRQLCATRKPRSRLALVRPRRHLFARVY